MSYRRVERTLGNLRDFPVGARGVERVRIASEMMRRRMVRLSSAAAGDLGIVLADDERLSDGDVVFADERRVVAVAVEADDVLVVRPRSFEEAARTAHAIGNRHIPLQVDGETLIVPADPALETYLRAQGVAVDRAARVLGQPFVHAHAPHGHGT